MAWIWISPWGEPMRTLAPRMSAREAGMDSSKTGSVMWSPPPPPPPSRLNITIKRRIEHCSATTGSCRHNQFAATPEPHRGPNPPALHSPRETEPSGSSTGGLGSPPLALRALGLGVGSVVKWSGVDWKGSITGVAPVRWIEAEATCWGTGGSL
jgi:hypothetical protein